MDSRAISYFLCISVPLSVAMRVATQCFLCVCDLPQAAKLAIKFLTQERAVDVIHAVGPRLTQLRKYSAVSHRTLPAVAPSILTAS